MTHHFYVVTSSTVTALVEYHNNDDFAVDYKVYFRFTYALTSLHLNDTDFRVKESLN